MDLKVWRRIISDEVRMYTDWSEDRKLWAITRQLKGDAAVWYQWHTEQVENARPGYKPITTWQELQEALQEQFQPPEQIYTFYQKFELMAQGNRSLQEYVNAFRQLLLQAPEIEESMKIYRFRRGLRNKQWRRQLGYAKPSTLAAAIQAVTEMESDDSLETRGYPTARAANHQYYGPQPMELDAMHSRPRTLTCFNCDQPGHRRAECRNPPKCYNCGKSGHLGKECRGQPRRKNFHQVTHTPARQTTHTPARQFAPHTPRPDHRPRFNNFEVDTTPNDTATLDVAGQDFLADQ